VLYRIRLQVERDLLTGRPVGTAPGPAGDAGARRLPDAQPRPISSAGLGIAASIAMLLLLDVVVTIRERLSGRT
jgi:hypothetical protein